METSIITDWKEALEIHIRRTKHEQWRVLTDDNYPNHKIYRKKVLAKANNLPSPRSEYEKVVISTGNGNMTAISKEESIKLIKEINLCVFFVRHSGCGCNRARCSAGKQGELDTAKNDGSSLVSFFDCATCLRPDIKLYSDNAYKKP
jgi:hypothetical protein